MLSVRSDVKAANAKLARLQAFVLDLVGPLAEALEGIDRKSVSAEDGHLVLFWAMPQPKFHI